MDANTILGIAGVTGAVVLGLGTYLLSKFKTAPEEAVRLQKRYCRDLFAKEKIITLEDLDNAIRDETEKKYKEDFKSCRKVMFTRTGGRKH